MEIRQRARPPVRRRVVLAAALLLLALTLGGCWDAQEIEKRTFPYSLWVDLTPAGWYRITALAPIPRMMGATGTTGPPGGPQGPKHAVFSSTAPTYAEAMNDLGEQTDRELDLSHLQVFVLGEELARRVGVAEVVEACFRDLRISNNAIVLVSRGPAALLTGLSPAPELFATDYIVTFFRRGKVDLQRSVQVELWQAYVNLNTPGRALFLPRLGRGPDNRLDISGLGVFRGPHLAGWLEAEDAQAFLWITRKTQTDYLPAEVPGHPGEKAILSTSKLQVRRRISRRGERYAISLQVDVRGNLQSSPAHFTGDQGELLRGLQQNASEELKRILEHGIRTVQHRYGFDAFGLGEEVRRRYPAVWTLDNWEEQFSTMDITVEVRTQIEQRGTIY